MGSFETGLALGRGIYQDAQENKLRSDANARAQAEADRQSTDYQQKLSMLASLRNVAQNGQAGIPGVTQGMTVPGPGGMGPVADPRDIDQTTPGNPYGQIAAPGATPDVNTATATPVTNAVAAAVATPPTDPSDSPAAGVGEPAPAPGADTSAPVQGPPLPLHPPNPDGSPATQMYGTTTPTPQRPGTTPYRDQATQAQLIGRIMLENGNVAGYGQMQDRANALKQRADSDDFGHQLMSMTPKQLFDYASPFINNNSNAPGQMTYDAKTRSYIISHPTGPDQTMDRGQLITYAIAAHNMGNGNMTEGVQQLMQASAAQRQEYLQNNQINTGQQVDIGKQADAVQGLDRQDKHETAMEALEAAKIRKLDNGVQGSGFKMLPGVEDKDGNPVMMNAAGETKSATGLRFMKDPSQGAPMTRAEVIKSATDLVTSGAKYNDNNGTPVPMDLPHAIEFIQRLNTNSFGPAPNGPTATNLPPPAAIAANLPPKPLTSAQVNAAPPNRIPDPPPQYGYNGNARAINPAYTAWSSRFTPDDYAAQQASDAQVSQAHGDAVRARLERNRGFQPPGQ